MDDSCIARCSRMFGTFYSKIVLFYTRFLEFLNRLPYNLYVN